MVDGLILSTSLCESLPSTGPVIQPVLFPDDTQRRIADLEQRLRESEAAYMGACNEIEVYERECLALRQVITTLEHRLEAIQRVQQVVTQASFRIVRR